MVPSHFVHRSCQRISVRKGKNAFPRVFLLHAAVKKCVSLLISMLFSLEPRVFRRDISEVGNGASIRQSFRILVRKQQAQMSDEKIAFQYLPFLLRWRAETYL